MWPVGIACSLIGNHNCIYATDLVGASTVTIFNILGQVMIQQELLNTAQSVDVSNLKKGNYLVRILNNGQETTTRLVVSRP